MPSSSSRRVRGRRRVAVPRLLHRLSQDAARARRADRRGARSRCRRRATRTDVAQGRHAPRAIDLEGDGRRGDHARWRHRRVGARRARRGRRSADSRSPRSRMRSSGSPPAQGRRGRARRAAHRDQADRRRALDRDVPPRGRREPGRAVLLGHTARSRVVAEPTIRKKTRKPTPSESTSMPRGVGVRATMRRARRSEIRRRSREAGAGDVRVRRARARVASASRRCGTVAARRRATRPDASTRPVAVAPDHAARSQGRGQRGRREARRRHRDASARASRKVGDLTKKVPLVGASVGKLGEGLTKAGESIHALPRVAQTRRGRLLVRSVVVGFVLVFSVDHGDRRLPAARARHAGLPARSPRRSSSQLEQGQRVDRRGLRARVAALPGDRAQGALHRRHDRSRRRRTASSARSPRSTRRS